MHARTILPGVLFILLPALSVAADQRLSDLFLQIQRLQQEVQQLRGRIELQEYELSTLLLRQREQYLDLDTRLRGRAADATSGHGAGNAGGTNTSPAPPTAVATTPREEKEIYRNAFALLQQRRYQDAIRGFEDLLARYPQGEFADNARYWLGETNYVERDYKTALTQFRRLATNYPLNPKVPASLLKIGYIHYENRAWQRARGTLQDILDKFPDTSEARKAESRLERMTREGH